MVYRRMSERKWIVRRQASCVCAFRGVVTPGQSSSRLFAPNKYSLLNTSENGAFLLNLPSHPRTGYAFFLCCAPTRRGTRRTPGEPTNTSYRAISAKIKHGFPPCSDRITLLYNKFVTTPSSYIRTPVWVTEIRLLSLSEARSSYGRTFRARRALSDRRRVRHMHRSRTAAPVVAAMIVVIAGMPLNDSMPSAWRCCALSRLN